MSQQSLRFKKLIEDLGSKVGQEIEILEIAAALLEQSANIAAVVSEHGDFSDEGSLRILLSSMADQTNSAATALFGASEFVSRLFAIASALAEAEIARGENSERKKDFWEIVTEAMARGREPGSRPGEYFVYFAKSSTNEIKIGASRKPEKRVKGIDNSLPYSVEIIGCMRGGMELERGLHAKFSGSRAWGEWFKPTPALLAYIRRNARPWSEINAEIEAEMADELARGVCLYPPNLHQQAIPFSKPRPAIEGGSHE